MTRRLSDQFQFLKKKITLPEEVGVVRRELQGNEKVLFYTTRRRVDRGKMEENVAGRVGTGHEVEEERFVCRERRTNWGIDEQVKRGSEEEKGEEEEKSSGHSPSPFLCGPREKFFIQTRFE